MRFVHLGLLVALNLEIPTSTYVTYMPTVRVTKGWVGKRTKAVFTARRRPMPKAIKRERYGEQPC